MVIRNVEVSAKLGEISSLLQDCKKWASAQPNSSLGAHLATYVDVCLLGVLEERIELLLRQRAWKPNDKYIANYIEGDLRQSFKNPKRGKICEVLGKFGPDLADAFRAKFSPTCSEINALESINSIKNNLAHVGAYDLKLTLQDVEDYFNRVVPILEVLESILS